MLSSVGWVVATVSSEESHPSYVKSAMTYDYWKWSVLGLCHGSSEFSVQVSEEHMLSSHSFHLLCTCKHSTTGMTSRAKLRVETPQKTDESTESTPANSENTHTPPMILAGWNKAFGVPVSWTMHNMSVIVLNPVARCPQNLLSKVMHKHDNHMDPWIERSANASWNKTSSNLCRKKTGQTNSQTVIQT